MTATIVSSRPTTINSPSTTIATTLTKNSTNLTAINNELQSSTIENLIRFQHTSTPVRTTIKITTTPSHPISSLFQTTSSSSSSIAAASLTRTPSTITQKPPQLALLSPSPSSSSSPASLPPLLPTTTASPPTQSVQVTVSAARSTASSTHSTPSPSPRQVTTIPVHASRTTATIITSNKRPTIIIYPTVSPETIVIPIVSCILGFPVLALMVICCLRRRAKLARERDRRRNYDMQDHAVSLVRFSPIHRLNNRSSRAISLRPERSLSRGFPSLELDTVIEERSDPEQTQTDIISPESPLDPNKFRDFNSS